jgi:hypothetical protein
LQREEPRVQDELPDYGIFDNPKACREQAEKYRQEAEQFDRLGIRDDLLELARTWDRMAADLENAQFLDEMRLILAALGAPSATHVALQGASDTPPSTAPEAFARPKP